jgi:UDP:flavonoid glycosyltransferase YjiC (YdhE family)
MRVLAACSLGGAGHLGPLVPLLEAARHRGDDVLVVGPPALSGMVAETGFAFRGGGEPPEEEVAPIRELLPVVPAAEASVLGNRELFGRLATTAMLAGMEAVCADWRPDLVLRDPAEYASAVVAHRLGIPTAQVAISLAQGEAGSIATASPALEAHRNGLTSELLASPYLTRFPASLDPSPFAATVRYRVDPPPAAPLPDWWPGRDGPLVYLTFGTVLGHMSGAAAAFRAGLEAVRGLDARVLLTVGRVFDRSALGAVPANVHVEAWVDQADVLELADLVVCHGGSGTAYGALAAGVPLVLVPQFADQFENSRRIADFGAGELVETGGLLGPGDARRIAEAITLVLTSRSYANKARAVAAEMAVTPPVHEALTSVLAAG